MRISITVNSFGYQAMALETPRQDKVTTCLASHGESHSQRRLAPMQDTCVDERNAKQPMPNRLFAIVQSARLKDCSRCCRSTPAKPGVPFQPVLDKFRTDDKWGAHPTSHNEFAIHNFISPTYGMNMALSNIATIGESERVMVSAGLLPDVPHSHASAVSP